MPELVIIGSGDHARVAIETAHAAGWDVPVLVELGDRPSPASVDGVRVATDLSEVSRAKREFVVAIGANAARARLFERALAAGGRPATLVHPRATILGGATIADGSHVCAQAVVGVAALVGRNVIVNTSATIDHDDRILDHVFIGPGCHLGGRVIVETGAHVGLGSSVVEGRKIGAWSFVAAGAVVVRDVPGSLRVAGVPARPMDERLGEWKGDV